MKTRNLIFSGLATLSVVAGGLFSGITASGTALSATSIHSTSNTSSSSGTSESLDSSSTTDTGTSSSGTTSSGTASSETTSSETTSSEDSTTGTSSGTASSSSTESSAESGTYTGSAYNTRWGAVQVEVTIANGEITDVTTLSYPSNDGRSVMISQRAIPTLRTQVLAAQSADIQGVSGATYTSAGYASSLQSALDQANF